MAEIGKISWDVGWCPELILCSGNVAFSGNQQEYEEAERFFDNLLSGIGLNQEQLFFVPDNHDIDLTRLDQVNQAAAKSLSYSKTVEKSTLSGRCRNVKEANNVIYEPFITKGKR